MMVCSDTLVINTLYRALGMRIGARTLMLGFRSFWKIGYDVADLSLFSIGSDCVFSSCTPQVHTYEERLLRIGPCHVGDGVTMIRTTAMAQTTIGSGCCVFANTVIMKGQSLEPNKVYQGVPANEIAQSNSKGEIEKLERIDVCHCVPPISSNCSETEYYETDSNTRKNSSNSQKRGSGFPSNKFEHTSKNIFTGRFVNDEENHYEASTLYA